MRRRIAGSKASSSPSEPSARRGGARGGDAEEEEAEHGVTQGGVIRKREHMRGNRRQIGVVPSVRGCRTPASGRGRTVPLRRQRLRLVASSLAPLSSSDNGENQEGPSSFFSFQKVSKLMRQKTRKHLPLARTPLGSRPERTRKDVVLSRAGSGGRGSAAFGI